MCALPVICVLCAKFLVKYNKKEITKKKNRASAKKLKEKAKQRFKGLCADNLDLESDAAVLDDKREEAFAKRDFFLAKVKALEEQKAVFSRNIAEINK